MKVIIKIISILGLASTIIPSILVFEGSLQLETNKVWMIGGTVLWFITAPFWLNKKTEEA